MVDDLFVFQRLKCQKILDFKCLFATDFVPDYVRFQLSSQQLTANKEFEMKSFENLMVKTGLKELFEKFFAFLFIHLSGKINLSHIDLVVSESGGELGDDLFGDFVVKLLYFIKLVHGRVEMIEW